MNANINFALKKFFWVLPYEGRRMFVRLILPQAYKRLQARRIIDTCDGYSLKPFDKNKCIFIHIPKTGGISVSKSLFGNLAGGHRKLEIYQIVFTKREFNNYFKFTFVRNPWDRLVSAYFYMKKGGTNDRDRIWAEQNLSNYYDFDIFVKNWINRENIETCIHFVPQYSFVCEPGSSSPRVNFIGYFEHLQEDFCYISKKLGLNTSLFHYNKTMANKIDYRSFYSEATRKIVAEVYRRDIEIFGYDFNNTPIYQQLSEHVTPYVTTIPRKFQIKLEK
jgi:hypothetical protein